MASLSDTRLHYTRMESRISEFGAKGIKFRVFNFCDVTTKKNLFFKIHYPVMSYSEIIDVATKSTTEIVNITRQVYEVVKKSKIKDGSLIVFTPHTTTAITVNEDESRLIKDIKNKILQLVPKGGGYHHDGIDGNAHSHILASLIGCSVTLPVISGIPAMGTWQSVLFIELDGPRNRRIIVQIN